MPHRVGGKVPTMAIFEYGAEEFKLGLKILTYQHTGISPVISSSGAITYIWPQRWLYSIRLNLLSPPLDVGGWSALRCFDFAMYASLIPENFSLGFFLPLVRSLPANALAGNFKS